MWKNLKWQALCRLKRIRNPFLSISSGERAALIIKSILAMGIIDYCFYRSFWMLFPLFLVGIGFYKKEHKELFRKKREQIRQQFKEMLMLTVTGQKAGYSVENAFLQTYGDLSSLYGPQSSICRMLTELKIGLENNRSVSELWKSMGEVCEIEEIAEFSEVFSIAKKSAGNMTVIMERTAMTIESRTEIQKEIETLISARKLEQKIMNVMPFILMLYIDITSPGYFGRLYHSPQGVVIMTFCLCIYLAAYLTGAKISNIEV